MYYQGPLIYFYLNGEIIAEIIPAFCNEISACKSEMRWNLNEHRAESVLIKLSVYPLEFRSKRGFSF